MRARNLVLESRNLEMAMGEVVSFVRKSRDNFTEIKAKPSDGVLDISTSVNVHDTSKSVSIDSLDRNKMKIEKDGEKEREGEGEGEEVSKINRKGDKEIEKVEKVLLWMPKEVEKEVAFASLEGGRSARLCAMVKKISKEKEILRQVRVLLY